MSQRFAGKRLVAGALLILLAVIIVLGFVYSPMDHVPAAQWGAYLEAAGVRGMLVFLMIGMLATSVGLPRQLVAFIGGLSYGVGVGLLLSLIAALCGCLLTATVSRRYFQDLVIQRFPKAINWLEKLTQHDFFLKILVLRLQPLGTNLMTNICIGFTSASLARFIAASGVGYIPQMLVFCLLGSGVRVDSQSQLVLSAVLLCISVAIGVVLYRRQMKLL